VKRLDSYRQSLLASFETCPRRAMHGLEIDDDLTVGNMGSSADLGSAFHAVAAEMLRTLQRQGEEQMPTQEAVEVMYEVLASGQWVLPTEDRHTLTMLVVRFASGYRWRPNRIMALEERLSVDIMGPDGEMRTLTGQPDLLVADPPDGVVICDWKTRWGRPKAPRQAPPAGEGITGKEYLSERGHFQLDVYGLLAMRSYPAAKRAILRELHLRFGEVREAVLARDDLEHVERQLGLHMMLLDQAITAGEDSPLWKPRPGEQCLRKCPVSRSCPIPDEQRGIGALSTPELAAKETARFVVVDAVRDTMRRSLKVAHEEFGRPIPIGDGTAMFWRDKPDGRREFGVWPVEDVPEPVEAEAC